MNLVESCPNCDRMVHPIDIVHRGRGKKIVCVYCEDVEEYKEETKPFLRIDGRKLKRLDLTTLVKIYEDIVGSGPIGHRGVILAILKGLAEGDEFEFHSRDTATKEWVVNFINKYIPTPNIVSEAIKKDATEIGFVLFKLNPGRKRMEPRRC